MNAQEIYKKRIEEAAIKASDVCEPCDYGDPFCASCHRPYMYDAAKKMGEVILNNQWIPIEEGLPPLEEVSSNASICVIVRTSEDVVRYAYYHHYLKQWFSAETSTRIDNVTKWMFVPEEGGE